MDKVSKYFRILGGLSLVAILGYNVFYPCGLSEAGLSGFGFASGYFLATGLVEKCPVCDSLRSLSG